MRHQGAAAILRRNRALNVPSRSDGFHAQNRYTGVRDVHVHRSDKSSPICLLRRLIVDEPNKEITGANGWQMVDAHRIKFVGTGGNFALQVGGNTIQIVERLAHSQAKAFAIS